VQIRVRCFLFAVTASLLAYVSLLTAHDALVGGVALVPLRRVPVIPVSASEQPLAYWFIVVFAIAMGIASSAGAIRLFWAVLGPNSDPNSRLMRLIVSRAEASAPSGLRPFWIALAVAGACFVVYALLS
jgi:hypothetical protein